MDNCIFCKIVKGDIPYVKVWENKEFLAILDVNPNTEGMTLVLTKKHYDSYAFDLSRGVYSKLMNASKKVGKLLEKKLKVKRVALTMEGLGVNHVHIKLFPLYGLNEKFEENEDNRVYFEKYPGYVTTQLGPQKSIEELKKVADKIRR